MVPLVDCVLIVLGSNGPPREPFTRPQPNAWNRMSCGQAAARLPRLAFVRCARPRQGVRRVCLVESVLGLSSDLSRGSLE